MSGGGGAIAVDFFNSSRGTLVNTGEIYATVAQSSAYLSTGVSFYDSGTVANSGVIDADIAVYTAARYSGVTDVTNSGQIYGAILVTPYNGGDYGTLRLTNSGMIVGNIIVDQGLVPGSYDTLWNGQTRQINDIVINSGRIEGTVSLADGDDVYDGRGGQIVGSVDAGGGADILVGGSFADRFFAGSGNDILSGGTGFDILTGGLGDDIFTDTAAGLNGDTITDFTASDRIVISNATLAGFSFSLSGSTLTYTGGTLTLTGGVVGTLFASQASGGGVQLSVQLTPVADVRNDFNGDGRSDILWRNTNGTLIDWLANADGTFTSNHAVATYSLDANFAVVGTGDFNGDGRDDLLLRHVNGTVVDWLGQANGGFVSNHAVSTYALGTNWTVAGTGDFNGDGRDDILWRNEVGAMSQWLGQTNGSFAYNPNAAYQLPTNWQAAATGDFNGDGRDDIMWRNEVGALSEWLGQANGTFVYNGNAAYQLPTNWTLAASADFNGDGRDDILWRNEVGAMAEWLANSDATFAYNPNAAYQLATVWQVQDPGI